MKIKQIVDNVTNRALNIPSFQRGYVWQPDRMVKLMDSLYQDYPISGITTWAQQQPNSSPIDMIVDGQQRVASIYACITGDVPDTYANDDRQPKTGIHFHLKEEKFGFPTPRDLSNEPMWIKVSDLFKGINDPAANQWRNQVRTAHDYDGEHQSLYDGRINRIINIREKDIAVEQIDSDKTAEQVIEIFERINSESTDLKREDLEIARMSTKWGGAKAAIRQEHDRVVQSDLIIQKAMNIAAIVRSMHAAYSGAYQRDGLKAADENDLKAALSITAQCNSLMSELIAHKLGMYDPKAVKAANALPALTRYLEKHGGFSSAYDEARALAYVLISNAWNAYRSYTDSVIDEDVKALQQPAPWDALHELLVRRLGAEPTVTPQMFTMNYQTPSRAYTLFHALSTNRDVRDWHSLKAIRSYHPSDLERHHIFPRAHLLSKYGNGREGRRLADDIANIAVISAATNSAITDSMPDGYLESIDQKDPHMLEQHCITRDRSLWHIDRYMEFLEERRKRLATAAQSLIDNLLEGLSP